MRIASLLPSATEIAFALGLGDQLVAVTHECDHPPQARSLPAVTRNLLPRGLSSAEIDRAVSESQRDAHTIYALDSDKLVALSPDLILTQNLCEVCAVPTSAVDDAVCSMPRSAQVLSLDPASLDDVLTDIERVGSATGRESRAREVVATLRGRIEAVRQAAQHVTRRPRVFCAEWLDPTYCAGHWVPEMVALAGGDDALGRPGQPSVRIEWEAVQQYAPEVMVLMPCGFDAAGALSEVGAVTGRDGWWQLPAVEKGRVFVVDASAYYARPGPRLVKGVEILARILHPDVISMPAPEGAVLRLVSPPAGGSSVENWAARFEPYH